MAAWPGGIRASDLLIGDESSGGFRPLARIGAGPAPIFRLELAAESAGALAGATATIRIERTDGTSPAAVVPVQVLESADAGRRVVAARLDRRAFRPGQYRLTVVVTTSAGETLTRSRLLTVPGDPLP